MKINRVVDAPENKIGICLYAVKGYWTAIEHSDFDRVYNIYNIATVLCGLFI